MPTTCSAADTTADVPRGSDEGPLAGETRAIRVNQARWRQRIPADAWPECLPGTSVLWRRDLFRVADSWRAGREHARALLTSACLWGYGLRGYGLARTLVMLAADPDGSKLDYNLAPLHTESPSEDDFRDAYTRFGPASKTHLHQLGPAFFSKLLYFSGYRHGTGGIQPLILDSRVAASLPREAGLARDRSWGWPAADWIAYLGWAAVQAQRPEFGGEPDAVEMALFGRRWTPGAPTGHPRMVDRSGTRELPEGVRPVGTNSRPGG